MINYAERFLSDDLYYVKSENARLSFFLASQVVTVLSLNQLVNTN